MSTENNRRPARHRKWHFDRDLAKVMRDNGWSWKALSDEFGVPDYALRYGIDEKYRAQVARGAKKWEAAHPEQMRAYREEWRRRPEVKARIKAEGRRRREEEKKSRRELMERLAYLEHLFADQADRSTGT